MGLNHPLLQRHQMFLHRFWRRSVQCFRPFERFEEGDILRNKLGELAKRVTCKMDYSYLLLLNNMFWFTMSILLGYIGIYDMGVLITRMDATIWFSQIDDWPNLKTIAMLTFQKGICFRLSIASVDYQFVQCSKRSTFRMYCTPKPCNVALSSAWLRPLTPFLGLKPRGSSVPSPFRIQPA